jgi:hypothetical protein
MRILGRNAGALRVLVGAGALLFTSGAGAAEPDDPAPVAAPASERYVGVGAPGAAAKNPLPLPKPAPTQLVWTGFRMKDAGSQIFLQTTREATYEVKPGPDTRRLTVLLKNCRVHLHNNGRDLDTRFFATPVASVKARQRRKDVELEIVLKEPVHPEPRTEAGPNGTHFVVLEFPPGQADPPRAVANSGDERETEPR